MSIIIHNMEMPETCLECPVYNAEFGWCDAFEDVKYADIDIKPDFCPMEECKSGKWLDYHGDYRCSSCGVVFQDMNYTFDEKLPNYCPNCGAKMKGSDDNERNN